MADNITAPVATGVILATDEISGVHFPRTKLSFGADGSAVDVSPANPLPVSIPAGGASSAKQDTLIGYVDGIESSLSSILTKIIAAPATEAKQDVIIGHVGGIENLLTSLLAQIRPATSHIAITPNASAIVGGPVRRLVIGGAGNITVTAGGQSVQYTVLAGQQLDIAATHVTAATATGIVGQF